MDMFREINKNISSFFRREHKKEKRKKEGRKEREREK
jgi:hypothetical protein